MNILRYDEYTSDIVSIEVVGESKIYEDKNKQVIVPKYIKNLVDRKLNQINNGGDGFIGTTPDGKNIRMILEVTKHYMSRLFRIEDPKNTSVDVVNPDTFEGINLIYNNRNYLAKLISEKRIPTGMEILIKTKDDSQYSLIFEANQNFNPKGYKITLISQIKGANFYRHLTTKTFKMHPLGNK
jgi:hypothetical protein